MISTLSLHDALPIYLEAEAKSLPMEALEEVHRRKTGALIAASCVIGGLSAGDDVSRDHVEGLRAYRSEEHTSELQSRSDLVCRLLLEKKKKIKITYI